MTQNAEAVRNDLLTHLDRLAARLAALERRDQPPDTALSEAALIGAELLTEQRASFRELAALVAFPLFLAKLYDAPGPVNYQVVARECRQAADALAAEMVVEA